MSAVRITPNEPRLAVASGGSGDGGDGGGRRLVMTPQLQQAIRLLQLSRLELIEEIRAECEAHPVLDDDKR